MTIYLGSIHILSKKNIFLQCVESSVYWPTKRGITIYADPDIPAARYDLKIDQKLKCNIVLYSVL